MSRDSGLRSERFGWLPAVAVVALAWLALFPITSVDAFYHLAIGRKILDERAIPARGVGSATFGQAAWHDNEWGFQLLAAAVAGHERDPDGVWVLTRGGTIRLILLRALCLAATLALLSAQMARLRVDPVTRATALVLAAFLTFGNLFWAIRPQIVSYLGLAAVAYLIERDRGGSRWAAWAAVAAIALWASFHGAFVIGIALMVAEASGEAIDRFRSPAMRHRGSRALRLGAAAVLSPLAACLNPHGYHQVLHPFLYLLRPEIHSGNVEWTRPDFLHLPLFVLTVVALCVGLVSQKRLRFAEIFRCAMFLGLLLTAIRHLPLAALILVPVTASSLSRASERGGWRARLLPTGTGWGSGTVRLAACVVLCAVIVALSGARFVGPWPGFREQTVRPMPEAAVRFAAREGLQGACFNAYRFGGFLMYRLYPAEVAFMDGRNDLYREFRDEVYNPILHAEPGWRHRWEDASRRYGIGWILVDEDLPIVDRLASDPGWLPRDPGGPPILDGRPGRDGIVLLLRDTPVNREKLDRLERMDRRDKLPAAGAAGVKRRPTESSR